MRDFGYTKIFNHFRADTKFVQEVKEVVSDVY
jgi:hemerythrin